MAGILMRLAAWAAVVFIALALAVWWRLREVIRRYRSIAFEIESLARSRDQVSGARRAALEVVVNRCTKIYRDPFPKAGSIAGIGDLVREVALCYHPGAGRPELKVRCGKLLWAARRLSDKLEGLLETPGFNRLGRLRLKRIGFFYIWFQKFQRNAVVRAMVRHSGTSSWILRSRLVLFPDPFSWLAFLSHRLVVMSLLRCVVTDLYLAVGVLAVECYDDRGPDEGPAAEEPAEAGGFKWFYRKEEESSDPRIKEIRRTLPGVTDSFSPAQWGRRWRRAVERAALVLASDQFPASPDPLKEASFGAATERVGAWLQALSGLEGNPMVRAVLSVKLETIMGLGDLAAGDAAARIGRVLRSCADAYSAVRIPVTAARWLSRGSPGRIALEAGWTLAGRVIASYCLSYGFDLACREMDILYRKSRSGPGPGKESGNDGQSGL